MKIKKSLIKEVMSVLIRNVGDARECPHCKKSFVPEDIEAKNSYTAYQKLKNELTKNA